MEVEINKIYTTNYGEKYRVLGELPIRDNNRRKKYKIIFIRTGHIVVLDQLKLSRNNFKDKVPDKMKKTIRKIPTNVIFPNGERYEYKTQKEAISKLNKIYNRKATVNDLYEDQKLLGKNPYDDNIKILKKGITFEDDKIKTLSGTEKYEMPIRIIAEDKLISCDNMYTASLYINKKYNKRIYPINIINTIQGNNSLPDFITPLLPGITFQKQQKKTNSKLYKLKNNKIQLT